MKPQIYWRGVLSWLALIACVGAAVFQLVPGPYSLAYLLILGVGGALVLSVHDGEDE